MADIFISYSSEDKTIVQQIAGLLEKRGWSVWWDRQIPIGQNFDNVIESELNESKCVLVIWTKKSVASEWVKSEAAEAASKKKLVPVILEEVTLPLSFKRVESAMMVGWNGEDDHPELNILYQSISNILKQGKEEVVINGNSSYFKASTRINVVAVVVGLTLLLVLGYFYLQLINKYNENSREVLYFLLLGMAIATATTVWGVINLFTLKNTSVINSKIKPRLVGIVSGIILIFIAGFYLPSQPVYKTITIRLFDHNKQPLRQGDVKIYLNEYIRSQSVDNMGQALFTGLPTDITKNKVRVEVTSPGYSMRTFDTILSGADPLELTMPLTAIVFITGKITTAADVPIKDVEISVDGTRYFAISINDGSYKLRLEEYTLGDEISLTTSHKNFEDKTISFKITEPNIAKDLVLNPVAH